MKTKFTYFDQELEPIRYKVEKLNIGSDVKRVNAFYKELVQVRKIKSVANYLRKGLEKVITPAQYKHNCLKGLADADGVVYMNSEKTIVGQRMTEKEWQEIEDFILLTWK